jgi:2-iminoacetate synthase
VIAQELLPSFCTACYRRGRTGETFMELAKPGDIQTLCRPNAILTFKEYLEDYASADVRDGGKTVIDKYLPRIGDTGLREETERRIKKIEAGERDLFF